MSKISGLLGRAKDAVAAGESSLRKAAELIAQAQAAGATQKQITKRLGKSRSWVTFLLAWRKGGYKGGAFDRSNRARVSSPTRQSKPTTTNVPLADRLPTKFNEAVATLKSLHAKPTAIFAGTEHDASDLKAIATFLLDVAGAMQMKAAA